MAITLRSSSFTGGGTGTEPSGVQPGDLLVAMVEAFGYQDITAPSGWTLATTSSWDSGFRRNGVYWLIRGAYQPSLTWSHQNGVASVLILAFTGAAGVDVAASAASGSSTTHTAPSVTVSYPGSLLLSGVQIKSKSITNVPSGMTQLYDNSGLVRIASQEVGTGATGTRVWQSSANNYGFVFSLALIAKAFATDIAVSYGSFTRTGPNNTPWTLQFTGSGRTTAYQIRTASGGGGTLVASGSASGGGNAVNVAYNAPGLVQGTSNLWLRVGDGTTWDSEYTFQLLRDDSASAPAGITTSPQAVGALRQYSVTFNAPDIYSTATNEMRYEVRTASGGGGTLLASGQFTQGNGLSTSTFTDSGLVEGQNSRWLRIRDGANNWAESAFTVVALFVPREDSHADWVRDAIIRATRAAARAEFAAVVESIDAGAHWPIVTVGMNRTVMWRVGGRVQVSPTLLWRVGGRVQLSPTLIWRVAPSPLRVHYALTGVYGPVKYTFAFERRTKLNQFIEDVTPAFVGGTIEANNDRDIFRTASFTVDASAVNDRGEPITINPLADHIAVFMNLLVDGSYQLRIPMGLFALHVPRSTYSPAGTRLEITASDNGIHLMESTTTSSYTVPAGANYIDTVRSIIEDAGLRHALPPSTRTLPAARTWPAGTPWLRVVNDLLAAAGMYTLWFDAEGVARTRQLEDLSSRTPDVVYSGNDFILIPIVEEAETTRLANQVVVVVDDPDRPPMSSVRTNADPDNPISTVTLGRTITKVITSDAADQETLDAIAENYLRREAGLYRRATLITSIDPRRDAREVYELTVDSIYMRERWWARNWRVELKIGGRHQHILGKVERISL